MLIWLVDNGMRDEYNWVEINQPYPTYLSICSIRSLTTFSLFWYSFFSFFSTPNCNCNLEFSPFWWFKCLFLYCNFILTITQIPCPAHSILSSAHHYSSPRKHSRTTPLFPSSPSTLFCTSLCSAPNSPTISIQLTTLPTASPALSSEKPLLTPGSTTISWAHPIATPAYYLQ